MTTELGPLRIDGIVLCELVRQEVGNKYSIIGAFSGDILVPQFPATISLSAFVQFRVPGPGQNNFKFRFSLPGDTKIEFSVGATHRAAGSSALAFPQMQLIVPQAGPIILEASADEGPWVTLLERRIANPDH